MQEAIQAVKNDIVRDCPVEKREEAWNETAKIVEQYSDEVVKYWNDEIDVLLTFVSHCCIVRNVGLTSYILFQAGLFSAILTAFNVQSYQLLQPADQTVAILGQISAQLASFALDPTFVNSTQPAFDTNAPSSSFRAPLYAIWLNCLWFASLVFSLASASIGILVKQWLKEYSAGLYGSSRDIARRRQYRLNNLRRWQVEMIVASLPVLLQIAVTLFLAGLIILVHSINYTVAVVVTSLVAVLLAFVCITTIVPAFFHSCAYRSPQAHAAFLLVTIVRSAVSRCLHWLAFYCRKVYHALFGTPFSRRNLELITHMKELLKRPHPILWNGEEQNAVNETPSHLDCDTMLTAYTVSLDDSCLGWARCCLADLVAPGAIMRYICAIQDHLVHRHGPTEFFWPSKTRLQYEALSTRAPQTIAVSWSPGRDDGMELTSFSTRSDVLEAFHPDHRTRKETAGPVAITSAHLMANAVPLPMRLVRELIDSLKSTDMPRGISGVGAPQDDMFLCMCGH